DAVHDRGERFPRYRRPHFGTEIDGPLNSASNCLDSGVSFIESSSIPAGPVLAATPPVAFAARRPARPRQSMRPRDRAARARRAGPPRRARRETDRGGAGSARSAAAARSRQRDLRPAPSLPRNAPAAAVPPRSAAVRRAALSSATPPRPAPPAAIASRRARRSPPARSLA